MSGFVPLPITDVRRETKDAISVALEVPPQHRTAFAFKPGQHINVRARIGGEDVQRTYSICSPPSETSFRIAIKRLEGGVFSTWANASLRAGMTLDAEPPTGRFVLAPSGDRSAVILGVAAGIGITPVIGILGQALLADDHTRVVLIYGNRTLDDAVFREELEALKDRFVERVTLLHILSQSEGTESPLLEGRIRGDKIKTLAASLFDAPSLAHAYLCGPGSMIKEVRDALFALGVPRDRVHHEFFAAGGGTFRTPPGTVAPSPKPIVAGASDDIEVLVTLDGVKHTFPMRPGEPVVEAALRAGLRAPYACKGGMCCTCRAKLVAGEVEMRVNYSLERWEIEQGFILTCQAVATSGRLVIDYDQM